MLQSSTTRVVVGLPVAAAITYALALFMQALITPRSDAADDPPDHVIIVTSREVDEPPVLRVRPTPPPDIDTPPPVRIASATAETPTAFSDGAGDRLRPDNIYLEISPSPIARVDAIYPPELARQNIEGACEMRLDIDPQGRTRNVRATACTHAAFAPVSVQAIRKWRYLPRVGKSGPETELDVRVLMLFQIQKG